MSVIMEGSTSAAAADTGASVRFDSIDQVRGAVMILMALDHVRWFFTDLSAYQPETLADTNLWLFLTRWVTHYCAPGFFLLAGIGVYLHATKVGNDSAVRRYLLSRGLFLVALELTVVGYSWVFSPGYSFGGVIWSLGCSFLIMAALVTVPRRFLLAGSVAFLLLHNALLDNVSAPSSGWPQFFWRALYQPGNTAVPGITDSYYFLFPILPWLAMMTFGFAIGHHYHRARVDRQRVFTWLATGMMVAFVALRLLGGYGNPDTLWISSTTSGVFSMQPESAKTLISFLNAEKYPPSLQFALMTLGPVFLWLGLSRADGEKSKRSWFTRVLVLFGRVPLFYYLCHLYLIHLLALAFTTIAGQPNEWIGFGADPGASRPAGYGFGLPVIHIMWMISTAILYVLCREYAQYKRKHTYAWLKYL